LNQLEIDGLKLHNLHIIKNTVLEKLYATGGFTLLNQIEYVALVVDFLERLAPQIVVHRLTGETYRAITVAPEWSINKIGVHNAIYKELEERDTWQGRFYPDKTKALSLDTPVVREEH
jgi:radical SAM superfamily enzyme